ncbi:DUF2235 domain-containing protein [Alteromonas ponticola]|uniref:DUF2235 domain-containing protein n=1 Tax=Alteromonas aquimaris TaxID=2998417 RepID=A0ABT3P9T4_9ALTE|nr:DUF2235 domain-containing protein [Alteromonas aquimaris]MCW8109541.1 DUF2235 domain-containing protein [Alteromonas aquimaris]
MRNLIVCCDGTWNDPANVDEGVPAPTNVRKLFEAIDLNSDQPAQLSRYQSGVGTGGPIDRVVGGLMGVGLSQDICDTYQWLADKYQSGDKVFLFGFSRGAFTARSLAGMIGKFGLVDFSRHADESRQQLVKKIYMQGYREGIKLADVRFHKDSASVYFIGVWDTVGALGIPDDKVILDLFDNPARYQFHDTRLGAYVNYARHGVAMNEKRGSFSPTLWKRPPAGVDMKQIWFPGVHSDVGGGYKETGLSDGALKWMIDEASQVPDGIRFHEKMVTQIRPNAQDRLHDSYTGIMKVLQTAPRAIPNLDGSSTDLHTSVQERRDLPPINQGRYFPTRTFVQNKVEVDIYAKHHWYWTGVYLQKGKEYTFKAQGEWNDGEVSTGPKGADDGNFQIGEIAHLAGNLMGYVEKGWKFLSKKEMADFWGSKRVEEAEWFSLIAAVSFNGNPQRDGTHQPLDMYIIGAEAKIKVKHSGYLYCFANDAWGFYHNNRGYVSATITAH